MNAPTGATASVTPASAKVLYANSYWQIYNVNGTDTTRYNTLPKPQCNGYVFRGWFYDSDCTGAEVVDGMQYLFNKDTTLYSKWEHVIAAELSQDSVSCYGYKNGKITVDITNRGYGNDYLVATFTKDNVSHTVPVGSGVNTFSIEGSDETPITAGVWTVTLADTITTHSGPLSDDACTFTGTIEVKQPELLAYEAVSVDQTCSTQGKVKLINVTGGTKPYHVYWTGSTGAESQAGDRRFSTSSTTISNLIFQDVDLLLMDAHRCRIGDTTRTVDTTVVINPANNALENGLQLYKQPDHLDGLLRLPAPQHRSTGLPGPARQYQQYGKRSCVILLHRYPDDGCQLFG